MTAVQKPLYIEQGATFVLSFQWCGQGTDDGSGNIIPGPPKDLTGWTFRMQIRKNQQSATLADASTTNEKIVLGIDPTDDLTNPDATPAGTPDPTNGWIRVKLTDEDTDLLTSKSCLYDLEGENPGGDVFRLLEGSVQVSPNITQEAADPVVGA